MSNEKVYFCKKFVQFFEDKLFDFRKLCKLFESLNE